MLKGPFPTLNEAFRQWVLAYGRHNSALIDFYNIETEEMLTPSQAVLRLEMEVETFSKKVSWKEEGF